MHTSTISILLLAAIFAVGVNIALHFLRPKMKEADNKMPLSKRRKILLIAAAILVLLIIIDCIITVALGYSLKEEFLHIARSWGFWLGLVLLCSLFLYHWFRKEEKPSK